MKDTSMVCTKRNAPGQIQAPIGVDGVGVWGSGDYLKAPRRVPVPNAHLPRVPRIASRRGNASAIRAKDDIEKAIIMLQIGSDRFACQCIPNTRGGVGAGGCHEPSVGTERCVVDGHLMPQRHAYGLSCGGFPNLSGSILAACQQMLSIGRILGLVNPAFVSAWQ